MMEFNYLLEHGALSSQGAQDGTVRDRLCSDAGGDGSRWCKQLLTFEAKGDRAGWRRGLPSTT
jgi:hypothetical protein